MKKLFIVLSVLMILASVNSARAWISASSYGDGKYYEQQVFTEMRNNCGAAVSSNAVVILDTQISGRAGTTLGSAFTYSHVLGSGISPIIGVTDEQIASGAIGRVCVYGPHKVFFTALPALNATVTTAATGSEGQVTAGTSTANGYFYLGTYIGPTVAGDSDYSALLGWVWINPGNQ